MNMTQEWTKQVSPQRYVNTWPNGPSAELARSILATKTGGDVKAVDGTQEGEVRFFSPRSKGLQIVIEAKVWARVDTPAGSQILQTEGVRAEFVLGILVTKDPKMIEYLTNIYDDPRYPVVRTDIKTKSSRE